MIADEATLARLAANAQKGDRQGYAVLLKQSEGWLRRYFGRRIPPNNLDDLVQETLLSLHTKLASYDPARPFLPWLAAIARYRWVDHLRKVYRAEEVALENDIAQPGEEDEAIARISLERLFATTANGTTRNPNNAVYASTSATLHAPATGALVPLNANTVLPAGGNQPHPNLQPYSVINFCIALSGIFPSRN